MTYAQKSVWFLHFSHYPLKGSGRCYFSFYLTLGYKSDGWCVTGQLGQGQYAKGSRAMTQKKHEFQTTWSHHTNLNHASVPTNKLAPIKCI